jgi:hypothetical protein
MYIGTQRIENPHFVPACEKFAQHVAADESCASGEQDTHAVPSPPL